MRRLVLGLGLLVAIVWVSAQRPSVADLPASGPPARSPLPSAVVAQVSNLQQALAQAKAANRPVPIALSFTELQLTASAAATTPATYGGVTVSDPVVTLRPGQIVLAAQARMSLLSGDLAATGVPSVAAGRPVITLLSATVAGVAVPDAARSQLQAALQQQLDAQVPATLQVQAITVATGTLTIQALALP